MDDRLAQELAECLDLIENSGASLEECLRRFPEDAAELATYLETVLQVHSFSELQPSESFSRNAASRLLAKLPDYPRKPVTRPAGRPVHPARLSRQLTWMTLITLFLILCTGVLTVKAADYALPGQMLYPVKTTVENTRLALSNANNAVALNLQFSERRLAEAAQLEASGKSELIPVTVANFWLTLERVSATVSYSPQTAGTGDAAHLANFTGLVQGMSLLMNRMDPQQQNQVVQTMAAYSTPPVVSNQEPALNSNCAAGQTDATGKVIAEQYGLTYDEVMGWVCNGSTYGDIIIALEASKNTELSTGDLLLLRDQLGNWDTVWTSLHRLDPNQHGSETASLDGQTRGQYCQASAPQQPVAENLAQTYGVSYENVINLFCQGYGFGEIMLALQTSQTANLPPDNLLTLKNESGGWGQVWQDLNLIGKDKPKATETVTPTEAELPSATSTPGPEQTKDLPANAGQKTKDPTIQPTEKPTKAVPPGQTKTPPGKEATANVNKPTAKATNAPPGQEATANDNKPTAKPTNAPPGQEKTKENSTPKSTNPHKP